MDAAIKTARISFPASDLALLKRLIRGMGWSISVDNEGEKKEQANLLRQRKKRSHIMIQ